MSRTAIPRARREVHADDEAGRDPDRGLDRRHRHHPAELAGEEGDAAHRREREAVQEPRLDVAREVGAGVHGREERALHERDGEREGEVRVRREARAGAWPTGGRSSSPRAGAAGRRAGRRRSPAGARCARPTVARADRPARRSPRSRRLERELGLFFLLARAFSSERPVLARKTSSSDGWCSWRFSTLRPSASSARTISARSASPVAGEPRHPGRGARLAEPREDRGGALLVLEVGRHDLDGRPPDLRLQLRPEFPRRRSGRGR